MEFPSHKGLDVVVSLKTSPDGAGDLLNEKQAQTVTVSSNKNPVKIDLTIDGKTYTFITAELGTAIMKASLVHG